MGMIYRCFNCDLKFETKEDSINHQLHCRKVSSDYDYKPTAIGTSQKRERSRSPPRNDLSRPLTLKGTNVQLYNEPCGWETSNKVSLDWYNSDLWLMLNDSGFSGKPLSHSGFQYMWAGCKATYGVNEGSVYFEVKVLRNNVLEGSAQGDAFLLRCGWSVQSAGMVLGEEPESYGYGGTGVASCNNKFEKYGKPFSTNDVIGCFVQWNSLRVPSISFSINGQHFGTCFSPSPIVGRHLFPHILVKNVEFEVNFGQKKPWYPPPSSDYKLIGDVPLSNRVRNYLPPEKFEDCTMIMMCGLPACGKSVWAEKYRSENPESRYYILGTNQIIDRIKMPGLPRNRNYHGRWEALIQLATPCLNTLFEVACRRKKNYILDQTNVYPRAQQRKMAPFVNYCKKAVVIVSSDEEYERRRQMQRAEGKEVPDHAVNEMKANFALPNPADFDEIMYPELDSQSARQLVMQYNEDGKRFISSSGDTKKPQQQNFKQIRSDYGYQSSVSNNTGQHQQRNRGYHYQHNNEPRNYSNNYQQNQSRSYGNNYQQNQSGSYGNNYQQNQSRSYGNNYQQNQSHSYGNNYQQNQSFNYSNNHQYGSNHSSRYRPY